MSEPRRNKFEWLVVVIFIIVSFALRSRARLMPRAGDDWAQQQMIEGDWCVRRGPLSLYDFGGRTVADRRALMDSGAWPWWSHPQLSLVMFRPMSSVLLHLDVLIAGHHTTFAHIHSLCWWALALLAVYCWLRIVFPLRIALFALALLCVEESATVPVVWIANRNALVAMTFSGFGLAALASARNRGSTRLAMLCALLLFAALMASEYALCFFGYAVATEFGPRGNLALRRSHSILAWAVPFGVWVLLYRYYGAGVSGSSVYIDPITDPTRFARVLPARIALLLRHLITTFPITDPNPLRVGPTLVPTLPILLGLIFCVWIASQSYDSNLRHTIVRLSCGTLFSLFPAVGSFTSARLALAGSIGVAVAFAIVLDGLVVTLSSRPQTKLKVVQLTILIPATVLIIVFHLVYATRSVLTETENWIQTYTNNERGLSHSQLNLREIRNGTVILIAAADMQTLLYAPSVLAAHGIPHLCAWRVLSVHPGPVLLRRTDAFTLDVVLLGSEWLTSSAETLFRSTDQPLSVGQRITVRDMTATVMKMGRLGPLQMRFVFNRSLDDRSIQLVWSSAHGLRRIPRLTVGRTVVVPAAQMPSR